VQHSVLEQGHNTCFALLSIESTELTRGTTELVQHFRQ
jgi:hypothetical protein